MSRENEFSPLAPLALNTNMKILYIQCTCIYHVDFKTNQSDVLITLKNLNSITSYPRKNNNK